MTTAAQQQQRQPSHTQFGLVVTDTYDPDEVVPRDSPLMTPMRPRIKPSPSPPPDISSTQVSLSFPSVSSRDKSNRLKVRPIAGDAVLVASLDGGRHPDIVSTAGFQALACDDDESPDDNSSPDAPNNDAISGHRSSGCPPESLKDLAAGALKVALAADPRPASQSGPDISTSTGQLSIHDDHPILSTSTIAHQARDTYPPPSDFRSRARSPLPISTDASGELPLPPLRENSPRSESNSQQLPSIRSTLGDITDKELPMRHASALSFPHSPPTSNRLPPMAVSPPVSPNDGFSRNLPSPHSLPGPPSFYFPSNSGPGRPSTDYSSSTTGETPSTDHSVSTPGTSTSVADRMSIDGITNPQIGAYACNFPGCTAPPFQTQYLLNSHANVHSSVRPHYCPVQGCPRSEGGKGFKRKNEMIRHGLVHDSPGYVCPFCPDREHKYPRPDNLQRHVRVHHVDKDKDDPQLREVLSQRPDGPNRGRRRRGPAS